MKSLKQTQSKNLLLIYLLAWFSLNLLLLNDFPGAHSDEPWLSGLTRHMLAEKKFDVTEPFFDLYPRHPHGLKIIFHILQMPFNPPGRIHTFFSPPPESLYRSDLSFLVLQAFAEAFQ